MHFAYYDSASSRNQYYPKLRRFLGKRYDKNDPNIYDMIKIRQDDAIRNAIRLIDSYSKNYHPEKSNPSTTVHLLVLELNKLI